MTILFADFLSGYLIFTVSLLPVGLFLLHLFLFLLGKVEWHHVVENISLSSLTVVSGFEWPYEMLFWPGMVPSLWLWFYIAAILIIRLAVLVTPVYRFSIYFFDIDQHPIRSVGVVFAGLVGCAYLIRLAYLNVAEILGG
jgi:hypothetical protein